LAVVPDRQAICHSADDTLAELGQEFNIQHSRDSALGQART